MIRTVCPSLDALRSLRLHSCLLSGELNQLLRRAIFREVRKRLAGLASSARSC